MLALLVVVEVVVFDELDDPQAERARPVISNMAITTDAPLDIFVIRSILSSPPYTCFDLKDLYLVFVLLVRRVTGLDRDVMHHSLRSASIGESLAARDAG